MHIRAPRVNSLQMQFDSIDFAIFFIAFFTLYWVCFKHLRIQNILLVVGSYIFYGWWDWRFLSLIFFSTVVDYTVGLFFLKTESIAKRKGLLLISIIVNLGLLGVFKYYNFFVDNFIAAFSLFGITLNSSSLTIILPVGISFYTFQTLSYSIDVYRKKIEPTKDFIAFTAFVGFFPQLVAGPIERAVNLLPQFYVPRRFNYTQAIDGLRQIVWGFFKKIVIADNCATFANIIFNNHEQYHGATLVLGAVFFGLQIYGDFSGYSDIAIGTSRLLGINLMRNFAFPYFSRDIAEFWRRWHISLSSWFRDYVYLPLGGSQGGIGLKIRNVFIIFLVSGFWHGANWTFIVWGGLNALYYLPLLLSKSTRTNTDIVAQGKLFPSFREAFSILTTFSLTSLAWIFFRSADLTHAFVYLRDLLTGLADSSHYQFALSFLLEKVGGIILILIAFFISIEWLGREQQFALATLGSTWKRPIRWSFYYTIVIIIIMYGGQQQQFIYFQF
jgi:alginate O-acetyltransferase complex protein AlgI